MYIKKRLPEKTTSTVMLNSEKIRIYYNMSQREMAFILNISLSTYQKLIAGKIKTLDMKVLCFLSEFSFLPQEYLMDDIGNELNLLFKFKKLSPKERRDVKAFIDILYNLQLHNDEHPDEPKVLLMELSFSSHESFTLNEPPFSLISIPRHIFSMYGHRSLCVLRVPTNIDVDNTAYKHFLITTVKTFSGGGTYLLLNSGELYFRKVDTKNQVTLTPLVGYQVPIITDIENFNKNRKALCKNLREIQLNK